MRRATLTFSCLLLASTAYAVKLTVITAKGYVQFVAGDDWRVIESQTKPPVAVIAFEIADPADEGTDDATNLAVNLYDATTDEGRDAMKLFKATVKSFSGSIGVYKPRKGEVTHRPKPRD